MFSFRGNGYNIDFQRTPFLNTLWRGNWLAFGGYVFSLCAFDEGEPCCQDKSGKTSTVPDRTESGTAKRLRAVFGGHILCDKSDEARDTLHNLS